MYKDLHRMFATTSTEQDTPGISRFVSSTGGRGGLDDKSGSKDFPISSFTGDQ